MGFNSAFKGLNYVLPRDFTGVDEGLQFTTVNSLQDKHKYSPENIATLACLASAQCSFSKLWLTKACNQP